MKSNKTLSANLEKSSGTVKTRMARGLAELGHIFAGTNPARNQPGGQCG